MTALRFVCSKQDCTVAATGKCLELHNPSECPNATGATSSAETERPTTARPAPARKFPPATELGLRDAITITGGGYTHLVAVLGAWNAGKTCMLNALYLLTLHAGLLPRFRFAGSMTLAGFELRTRRLRKWEQGRLPDQLADHTNNDDPRNPGLLHLALEDSKNGHRRVELLLTDLPGEWTTGLIKQSQNSERFEFLQRADSLVIAVDGKNLLDASKKHVELLNARQLIDRLADAVNLDRATPVFIAVCKSDEAGLSAPAGVDGIVDHAIDKGFVAQSVIIASLSGKPGEIPNGHGIRELIEAIIDHESPAAAPVPISPEPVRSFGRSLGLA